jgi:hypothetical protein
MTGIETHSPFWVHPGQILLRTTVTTTTTSRCVKTLWGSNCAAWSYAKLILCRSLSDPAHPSGMPWKFFFCYISVCSPRVAHLNGSADRVLTFWRKGSFTFCSSCTSIQSSAFSKLKWKKNVLVKKNLNEHWAFPTSPPMPAGVSKRRPSFVPSNHSSHFVVQHGVLCVYCTAQVMYLWCRTSFFLFEWMNEWIEIYRMGIQLRPTT